MERGLGSLCRMEAGLQAETRWIQKMDAAFIAIDFSIARGGAGGPVGCKPGCLAKLERCKAGSARMSGYITAAFVCSLALRLRGMKISRYRCDTRPVHPGSAPTYTSANISDAMQITLTLHLYDCSSTSYNPSKTRSNTLDPARSPLLFLH